MTQGSAILRFENEVARGAKERGDNEAATSASRIEGGAGGGGNDEMVRRSSFWWFSGDPDA
eukprot:CAMPEP_0184671034 /NCGR_PEP_ID=MMETSP0308-20130426/85077_1 /TAXON_ID=38269 /ORGANISM="Gloeochaete witrockiana, Strain SAG 46.84" /LENGTH=60 /DNA_ID=CAMNT_0027118045 /DNA_START=147 /DNA_END=326 /DNA_ORIENTATION=+